MEIPKTSLKLPSANPQQLRKNLIAAFGLEKFIDALAVEFSPQYELRKLQDRTYRLHLAHILQFFFDNVSKIFPAGSPLA